MSKGYVRVGGWRIALHRLPAAIGAFKSTLHEIDQLASRGQGDLQVVAMGNDDVSRELATEVNRRHVGGDGSMQWAANRFQEELRNTISALEAAERHYRKAESNNKQNFAGA